MDGEGLVLDGGPTGPVGVTWGLQWGVTVWLAPPFTEVAMVDGRDGSEAEDLAVGDAEDVRPLSSSPSPGRASFGLRRSEISTFDD